MVALQFSHVFKTILFVSEDRGKVLTWLIFHLFGNLTDYKLATVSLAYYLLILRYF